jgi:hypothetical protein
MEKIKVHVIANVDVLSDLDTSHTVQFGNDSRKWNLAGKPMK